MVLLTLQRINDAGFFLKLEFLNEGIQFIAIALSKVLYLNNGLSRKFRCVCPGGIIKTEDGQVILTAYPTDNIDTRTPYIRANCTHS